MQILSFLDTTQYIRSCALMHRIFPYQIKIWANSSCLGSHVFPPHNVLDVRNVLNIILRVVTIKDT